MNELGLKERLDDVMLPSVNCSDIQMALRTDLIVDRTFPGSNGSPTKYGERLLTSDQEAVRESRLILLKGQ